MNKLTNTFCLTSLGVVTSLSAATHPLDALDENEIISAAQILLEAGAAQPGAMFQSIDLQEPAKALVLAFQPGDPIPRSARVFYRQNKTSFRTVVNLILLVNQARKGRSCTPTNPSLPFVALAKKGPLRLKETRSQSGQKQTVQTDPKPSLTVQYQGSGRSSNANGMVRSTTVAG